MTKQLSLALLLVAFTLGSAAQEPVKKIRVQSISSLGVLNGGKGTAMALQSIVGVNYHRGFVGVGLGIDYYRYRSIPLFADLRYEFGKGSRNLFVYGDVGYNYDWLVKEDRNPFQTFIPTERFSGGVYYDAGVGVKFGFKTSDALILSAGYSQKQLKSETGSGVCPVVGPCYDGIETYRYYLSRLMFKLGWRF